jgi:predicted GTPase
MLDDNKPITGSSTYQKYEERQQQREALVSLMEQQVEVLRSLDMASRVETLDKVKQHLLTDDFKVLVLGEFKTGKSTFINALLGAEVLPAYATPTTAIINEIKWGEERRALLHLKVSKNGSAPPVEEVPVEELEDYVVIQHSAQEIRASPYDKVELFWPLELCRNGVDIIDSPGLNEHEVREKVTLNYLEIADAVLFVMSSERIGPSRSEAVSIKALRAAGHERIFFLCNRFHQLPPREQDRVREYGFAKLSPLTELGAGGVFFVDSLDALQSRLNNDPNLLEDSAASLPS